MFNKKLASITVAEAALKAQSAGYLLDVREVEEWREGHAPAAHHRPLATLDAAQLPTDVVVMCICRSGARSARATAHLLKHGVRAVNVEGGMNAWNSAGLPVINDDHQPGVVI